MFLLFSSKNKPLTKGVWCFRGGSHKETLVFVGGDQLILGFFTPGGGAACPPTGKVVHCSTGMSGLIKRSVIHASFIPLGVLKRKTPVCLAYILSQVCDQTPLPIPLLHLAIYICCYFISCITASGKVCQINNGRSCFFNMSAGAFAVLAWGCFSFFPRKTNL